MSSVNTKTEKGRQFSDDNVVMFPYSMHDHCNRHKIHIQENGKAVGSLCGFYNINYASALPHLGGAIIDKEWLDQPDPDHVICQHCRKIATKKLAT